MSETFRCRCGYIGRGWIACVWFALHCDLVSGDGALLSGSFRDWCNDIDLG